MEDTLKRIQEFADKAHGDQQRKYTPERYIVHPVRVMNIVRKHSSDIAVLLPLYYMMYWKTRQYPLIKSAIFSAN